MRRSFYSADQRFEILRWCDRRSTDKPAEFRDALVASNFLRKCMNNHVNMAAFRHVLRESFYANADISRLADGEIIDHLATEIIRGRIKIVEEGEEVEYEVPGGGAPEAPTEPEESEPAETTSQTTPPPPAAQPAPSTAVREPPPQPEPEPEPEMSPAAAESQAETFAGAAQSGSPFCEI